MRVGALGPGEVLAGDAPVNLGGPKPKALLAALMLQPRHVCRRAVGDADGAAELSEQALAVLERTGDALGATYARQSLAKARIRQGRLSGVAELLNACLAVCGQQRDRFGIALTARTISHRWADDRGTAYWGFEQAGGTGTVHRIIDYPYDNASSAYRASRYLQLHR